MHANSDIMEWDVLFIQIGNLFQVSVGKNVITKGRGVRLKVSMRRL